MGADVSTLGELAFARAAGIPGDRILFHGNNKSDEELAAAAVAGVTVVLDAPDEPERAAAAGVQRVLVRLTPGVEAHTHQSIRDRARGVEVRAAAGARAVGDRRRTLTRARRRRRALPRRLAARAYRREPARRPAARSISSSAPARARLAAAVLDIGGGLGIRYTHEEEVPEIAEFVAPLVAALAAPACR